MIEADNSTSATRDEGRVRYGPATVLPVDPRWGSSVLPLAMDDEDDGLYGHLALAVSRRAH